MLLAIALALSPFVQVGLSYWVSNATLAAGMVVAAFRRNMLWALFTPHAVLAGLIALFLFPSLAMAPSVNLAADILFVARLGLIFFLLVLIMIGSRRPVDLKPRLVVTTLLVIALALLALVALQSATLPRVYIGLPRDWFVQNENTLPTLLDLLYSRIRPMGVFGEPSYLGFYCLSLIFISLPGLRSPALRKPIVVVLAAAILTGLLSQSIAFVTSASIVIAAFFVSQGEFWRRVSRHGVIAAGVGTAACVVIGLALLSGVLADNPMVERLGNVISGQDMSANMRILDPVTVIPDHLTRYPLGMPRSVLLTNLGQIGGGALRSLDNAAFYAVFQFGLPGIMLMCAFLASARSFAMGVYLFMVANFNGALFAIDKLAIIGLVVILHVCLSRSSQTSLPNDDPSSSGG